ncbi:hypothetical protein INR49_016433 [Caranx melampygus]|nr:hypothetical protein INR49_016433 [Caranx melampygus]
MKMGKKRRGEGSAESDTPAKKEKVPEFNGTVFKAMLKEPTTAMKGLETFISTAKKLPCSDLYDVVEGYIKISMECAEIFKLLEGEKHTENEMMLVFESLEMILLRTASDLTHFNMVGNAIVVLNKAISKTQKVRFFTPAVLTHIASLYKWNGIVDATTGDNKTVENSDGGGISVIRELAHSFLVDLCSSRKHGISFHDASLGTAGRPGNIVLLQFLVGLKQATEDELVAELVVNILKASPDLLARYFKETQYSYTPRLKSAWQDNIRLLKKIYQAQPELSTVFQTNEVIPLPRLLSMIMILPDMTSIVSKWQSLSKKEKTSGEEKKAKTEGSSEQTDNKNEVPDAETAEVIMLKALILKVICLYQKVVPHLVSQCKFDFSKLLKGIVSEKGVRDEVPPVLQYQILQLALDLPASKFSWFRIQDVADTESSSGEKSVLYLLLKMFVSSSSSHLRTSTRLLVVKVLKDSGVFEYTWTELELWLDQLTRVEPYQQEIVIQFLERVLVKLVCNSHTYTDKVASLVQEAANLQASLGSQEGDAASIPVSHIDDVLDMLDVIMEGNDGEMEEFGPSLSEDLIIQTFPFSVVVPAALEARNKLPANKGVVYEYLSAVLSDVLHCQREPLPLCLAMLQYDKELVSSELGASPHPAISCLHQYYSKWLPQQRREELFKSSECLSKILPTPSSYTALMKAAYSQGPSDFLEDTFGKSVEETQASMSIAEFPVAIRQMLLYIKSTVDNFGTFSKDTGAAVLKTLMKQLQDLVTKLQGFQETKKPEPEAENFQEGSDLFLELNQSSTAEADKEQILVSVLGSIFKHPCLEQWFLALELCALPPHTLNPVRLKHLCAQLTDDILALLKISAPIYVISVTWSFFAATWEL